VDMDQQRVDPVFRLKIKDWLSIKVGLFVALFVECDIVQSGGPP
jgi:hypothetical protein